MSFPGRRLRKNYHIPQNGQPWRNSVLVNPYKKNNVTNHLARFDLNKIRKYLDNGDVDMTNNPRKISFTKSRPNSNPVRGRPFNSIAVRGRAGAIFTGRYALVRSSYWFKITLFHAKTYGRQETIKMLQNYITPVILIPIGVREEGDNVVFFIDDKRAYNALVLANLKLEMKDGSMMQIKIESKSSVVDLTPDLKRKITAVMSSKYDTTKQHLDLTRFFAHQTFLQEDQFVSLSNPKIASCVCEIIAQRIPNVKSLNLSGNKIYNLRSFQSLKNFAKELKSLNLSRNKINQLNDLKNLEGLNLDSLTLSCNPVCSLQSNQTAYVRAPEVEATVLSSVIWHFNANLVDDLTLASPAPRMAQATPAVNATPAPSIQSPTSTNQDGRVFTSQFLQTFYAMYDHPQGDRSALKEAYALTAEFSLTTSNFTSVNSNKFVTANRNLIRVNNHFEGKTDLMLIGQQHIVQFLSTLPKTQHDLGSLNIDLLLFTSELVSLRIQGVFREAEYDPSPIKSFNREFTLISSGTGYSIVRDGLCRTEASTEQTSNAFGSNPSSIQQVAEVSNLLKSCLSLETAAATTSTSTAPENKIAELSKITGMNLLWSKKCLDETGWDSSRALEAFNLFKETIPAEAFVV